MHVVNINSKYLFIFEEEATCQSLYYFIAKTVNFFIMLIAFLVLVKHYKLRVRENEVL